MKKYLIAGALAATSVAAQITGEMHRHMAPSPGMQVWWVVGKVLWAAFALGLTLLVWLWVVKLSRELRSKKRR